MDFPHLAWPLTLPLVALQSRADFYMDAETHFNRTAVDNTAGALFTGEMAKIGQYIHGN